MADGPAPIDNHELRLPWALDGEIRRDHSIPPSIIVVGGQSTYEGERGSALAIISASSCAAASGRFNVAGSASGIARACICVSMSPGSSDKKRMLSDSISACQILLR